MWAEINQPGLGLTMSSRNRSRTSCVSNRAAERLPLVGRRGSSFESAAVILLGVEDAKNDHAVRLNAIEDLVGESFAQQSSESTIIDRRTFGKVFKAEDQLAHLRQKVVTQTRLLPFVPLPSPSEIGFRARADEDAPTHELPPRRMRASTSSQVAPALGFA